MAHPGTPPVAETRSWRRALVLGGIRSGKSEFAESLLMAQPRVRYVAAARRDPVDAEWSARIDAHRDRRPGTWSTTEVGDDPLSLPELLCGADPAEALLVDDLGTWVASVIDVTAPAQWPHLAARLAGAVAACPARLVLVTPEVGLSLVPATAVGRAFADALGLTNRTVSASCDTVVLIIAGNAVPVKGSL